MYRSIWCLGTSIRQSVNRFWERTDGNFGMLFALLLPALVVAGGGVIDIANVHRTKIKIQNSADVAALAAAQLSGGSFESRSDMADQIFRTNTTSIAYDQAGRLSVSGKQYIYSATANVPTIFLRIANINEFDLRVEATAVDASPSLDVALVLDVSGSMEQGTQRLAELKKAVKVFLDQFDPGVHDIKVAMIPFNGQVKVHPNQVSTSDFAYHLNPFTTTECIKVEDPQDRAICQAHSFARVPFRYCSRLVSSNSEFNAQDKAFCGTDIDGFRLKADFYRNETYNSFKYKQYQFEYHAYMLDGVRIIDRRACTNNSCAAWERIFQQDRPIDLDPVGSIMLARSSTETWSGCVLDRSAPFDTSAAAPTASDKRSYYPKARCSDATLKPAMALTNSLSTANDYAQALQAGGPTNVIAGVQWGMEALSPTGPLQGARTNSEKIMIVLTDGENTHSRWEGGMTADGTKKKRLDDKTLAACASAKQNSVEVYTINLIGGDAALLSGCASQGEQYYHAVTQASELTAVFAEIAQNLKKIRLAF